MSPRSPRPQKSLHRKVGTKAPRKTFIIFCEGERTELEYLTALKNEATIKASAAVELRLQKDPGVPSRLVKLAVAFKNKARDELAEIDEVWCVFDVEWPNNHPELRESVAKAQAEDVLVAISNPCFELWLLLHFKDVRAWPDNDGARRGRRACDSADGKGVDGAVYMPLRQLAAKRAMRLDQRHESDGNGLPDNNPSSGMYRLLASIEAHLKR